MWFFDQVGQVLIDLSFLGNPKLHFQWVQLVRVGFLANFWPLPLYCFLITIQGTQKLTIFHLPSCQQVQSF